MELEVLKKKKKKSMRLEESCAFSSAPGLPHSRILRRIGVKLKQLQLDGVDGA